jgi:transcriptional antiterminator RfaH
VSPGSTECAPTGHVSAGRFDRTAAKFDFSSLMPILLPESDIYPADLLTREAGDDGLRQWRAFYLLSRREKDFMRRLRAMEISHYCPIIAKRNRSPGGRVRTSYVPLFAGYVFVYGTDEDRYRAMTTNCVSRWMPVPDGRQLTDDLLQVQRLIAAGAPLTPESRLEPGEPVRIKKGPFVDLEGTVVKRHGQTRLVVAVRFLQQGASILLEDYEVESI